MNPREEATIRAFVDPRRRLRWLGSLASEERRVVFLDRLNHCRDLGERYAMPLPSNADVVAILKVRGALKNCYVLSADESLDGREMPLEKAVVKSMRGGWGTILCCLPGRLAFYYFYYDECGERRFLLERKS